MGRGLGVKRYKDDCIYLGEPFKVRVDFVPRFEGFGPDRQGRDRLYDSRMPSWDSWKVEELQEVSHEGTGGVELCEGYSDYFFHFLRRLGNFDRCENHILSTLTMNRLENFWANQI